MYCISISHKVAPLHIREKFAFSIEEQIKFQKQMVRQGVIHGCVVLSTCNRSEIYFTGDRAAIGIVEKSLADFKQLEVGELLKYYRIYEMKRSIYHLYSVASGMDSMVLGEDEILGQVKKAYQIALENNTTDPLMNRLFQGAINSAKKVKNKTLLSKTSLSIGTLVAHEIFDFNTCHSKKNVLIIGITGKMGTIIMKNILHREDVKIIGTTRQHGYSLSVADSKVEVIDYAQRYAYIDKADIIISATASPHYTLTYQEIVSYITHQKPRLFIDLAVPIDIDTTIQTLPLATLYNIDYFKVLAKRNNEIKLKEIETGRCMIEQEVETIMKKISFSDCLEEIQCYEEQFKEKSFKQFLFDLRDRASSEELEVILKVIKRITEEGGKEDGNKRDKTY